MMTKIEMQAMDAVIGIHREMRRMNEPDWEKRRYELAKEIFLRRMVSYTSTTIDNDIEESVAWADRLIAKLKKGAEPCD